MQISDFLENRKKFTETPKKAARNQQQVDEVRLCVKSKKTDSFDA